MALKDLFLIEDRKERSWVIWLSIAIFFLSTGAVMLTKLLEAFVIKRIGVQYLPFIHIIGAFVITFGAWFSLSVLRKWRAHLQSAVFAGIAVVGAFILALTQSIFTSSRSPAFNMIFVVVGVLVGTMSATNAYEKIRVSVSDVFDYVQFRRFGSIFASVATMSVFVAGLLLVTLSSRVSLGTMYLLDTFILALSLPSYLVLGRMAKFVKVDAVPAESKRMGFLSTLDLRRHIDNTRLRHFLMLLALIIGLSAVFSEIFQYGFDVVANARYASEQTLNGFFGGYIFLLALGTLVFIHFFQNALFERYGLTNNLYTPPLVVLLASLFMFAYPFFWIVVGVIFMREIILGVQDNAYDAMMEGIGDYQRKQAWAWIRGPAHSVFNLFGAILLLGVGYLFLPRGTIVTIRVLAILALIFLLIRFLLTVRLKRAYPGILLDAMGRGDFKTRLRAIEAMAEMRYMKERHLGEVLRLIQNEEEPSAVRVTALRALGEIRDPSVLRVVSRFIRHPESSIRIATMQAISAFDYHPDRLYESGFSRHTLIAELKKIMLEEKDDDVTNAILDALISLRDPDIIPYLIDTLKSGDETARYRVLRSIKKFKDPAIIDYVIPYLDDGDPRVKAQALIAIWQFPWERRSHLQKIVDKMLSQDILSDDYVQGLYLVGALKLRNHRKNLLDALKSEDSNIRLTASIGLFKLGDNAGITVARHVMAEGSDKEAHRIIRLRHHHNVPKAQQAIIEAIIHRYHLHYPQNLPVSEPLRVRLVSIPKACLEGLLAYYSKPSVITDRRKIEGALRRETFPENKGRVILAGISDPWREMAAVALLANGYLVREASVDEIFDDTAVVVADVEAKTFPERTVYLEKTAEGLAIGHVAKTHYAPSELVTEVEKLST